MLGALSGCNNQRVFLDAAGLVRDASARRDGRPRPLDALRVADGDGAGRIRDALVLPDGLHGCGPVAPQGCCAGATLVYCDSGRIEQIDCGANPSCGWDSGFKVYDCGTKGGSDPSSKYVKRCPF